MPVISTLIVVDDGSTDGSGAVAKAFADGVIRTPPKGKPSAVCQGFHYALRLSRLDHIIVFDGDGQHPPESLSTLVDNLSTYGIVKGSRFHPESLQYATPPDRRRLNHEIRSKLKEAIGWDIVDPQCGLIGLRPEIVRMILPRLTWSEEWEIEFFIVLAHALGFGSACPVYEFPIPALYTGLPGFKQREKYNPQLGMERFCERFDRQTRVIRDTLSRLAKL